MNVILLILDSQAIGLHGRSTSLQVIPYESALIGLSQLTIGYWDLQVQKSNT